MLDVGHPVFASCRSVGPYDHIGTQQQLSMSCDLQTMVS